MRSDGAVVDGRDMSRPWKDRGAVREGARPRGFVDGSLGARYHGSGHNA